MPFTIQPDLIKSAWKAGKNVISEKPIAKDVITAKELVSLWEETYKPKGIQWHIAEQYPVSFESKLKLKTDAKLIGKGSSSVNINSTSQVTSKCVN